MGVADAVEVSFLSCHLLNLVWVVIQKDCECLPRHTIQRLLNSSFCRHPYPGHPELFTSDSNLYRLSIQFPRSRSTEQVQLT